MTKLLRSTSDKMLKVALPAEDAGACVPGHGDPCGCVNGILFRYDCLDNCVINTHTPC